MVHIIVLTIKDNLLGPIVVASRDPWQTGTKPTNDILHYIKEQVKKIIVHSSLECAILSYCNAPLLAMNTVPKLLSIKSWLTVHMVSVLNYSQLHINILELQLILLFIIFIHQVKIDTN